MFIVLLNMTTWVGVLESVGMPGNFPVSGQSGHHVNTFSYIKPLLPVSSCVSWFCRRNDFMLLASFVAC